MLRVKVNVDRITFEDEGGLGQIRDCGVRDNHDAGGFTRLRRRRISYPDCLLAKQEYREAMAE